jgi:hypothetical protein
VDVEGEMMETFTLKQEHLNLLENLEIDWSSGDYGAPAIDGRRPYGNYDLISDIAWILGIKPEIDNEFNNIHSQSNVGHMLQLHHETCQALQIVLHNVGKAARLGVYEQREDLGFTWRWKGKADDGK